MRPGIGTRLIDSLPVTRSWIAIAIETVYA